VVASYGHIRDLPGSASEIPEKYRKEAWARLGVDINNEFKPVYIIPANSKKHITALKGALKRADELLLATDEDREGESISWHLLEVLKPRIPVGRITFHEITKGAIREAVANPRKINDKLVKAQESRRILDRLFGYSLSPVLWKKVRTKLSAGRVQSAALRLVVEREEERMAFVRSTYWDVEAELTDGKLAFPARLIAVGGKRLANGKDFDPDTGKPKKSKTTVVLDQAAAEKIADGAQKAVPWKVVAVEHKSTRQRPAPPFTTSTLQQAAGSRLNMSPRKTMMTAQKLYEGIDIGNGDRDGLITYMRTDSVTLSEKALSDCGRFVTKTFGDKYYPGQRRYKTLSKGAQEAHEAIRPTDMFRTPEAMAKYLGKDELALYRLIWNRCIASQMADAEIDKTAVDFETEFDKAVHTFRANGSTVRFDGYQRVWGNGGKDVVLPEMTEGQAIGGKKDKVQITSITPVGHETSPPARYTESSLVKKLEEEGIGRPSTYAPTITVIQQRDYVFKKSGALVPTYLGMAVTRLLRQHFTAYIDLKFTARMETALDNIASGDIEPEEFLSDFYHGNGDPSVGLLEKIEKEMPEIDFPAIPVGDDPKTKEPIVVRIGKSSAYLQRGQGDKQVSAPIPKDLLIDELTVDKAHELLAAKIKGDEPLGVDPETGQNVYALVGPYGPYVQLGESNGGPKPKRVSLAKGTPIESVTLERALQLLSLPRTIGTDPNGDKVTASIGPYGPYVERNGVYRSLDSVDMVFAVGLDEAVHLLDTKPVRKGKETLKELGDHPESGLPLKVMKGRYGPYVTDGKVNASLSGKAEPNDVTIELAVQLLEDAAERKKTRRPRTTRRVKSAAKTSKKKPAKKSAEKPAAKKSTSKKTTAKKTTTKKTTAKKSTATKTTAKRSTSKTVKKAAKRVGRKK
jgi:DNA topoisomerase-1